MPDMLVKIPFTQELLPDVQGFHCGSQEWETPLAKWITANPSEGRGSCLRDEQTKGPSGLAHVRQNGDLVGYSSLGTSKWEWPTSSLAWTLSIIPYVAIQEPFQGKPRGDPPKYSNQILEHLKHEARQHTKRKPLLGLFVDPRNERDRCVRGRGFQDYFRVHADDGIVYKSMMLNLTSLRLLS